MALFISGLVVHVRLWNWPSLRRRQFFDNPCNYQPALSPVVDEDSTKIVNFLVLGFSKEK